MKTTKTYATLAGAYVAAEKAGATTFDITYNDGMVFNALNRVFKSKNAVTVAKNNLVRYEKTLCALECVKDGFKWTVAGHFDSEGLLYPVCTDAPKPKTEDKPKTKAPRKAKGSANKSALQRDLDTLAGTGNNSKAHKIMCKHGLKDSSAPEYQAMWKGYWWTIR